jgi:hypothetical protein
MLKNGILSYIVTPPNFLMQVDFLKVGIIIEVSGLFDKRLNWGASIV